MTEPIGKPEDLCLFPYEKHYIVEALEEHIKDVESDLERMLKEAKELPEGHILRDSLEGAAREVERLYLRDLRVVLERVKNTPECE